MTSRAACADPLSRVRAGAMLGELTQALGIRLAELASGLSEAQVRAYLDGRREVSAEAASLVWKAFARRVLLVDSENVIKWIAAQLHERAIGYERLAATVSACVSPLPRCQETWLPWVWLGGIELALHCAMSAEDNAEPLGMRVLLADGFGPWLALECTRLGIPVSASALAGRIASRTASPKRQEALRRRFQRYLNGVVPNDRLTQVELAYALVGTKKLDEKLQSIGGRVAWATSLAQVHKSLGEVVPLHVPVIVRGWLELYEALSRWVKPYELGARIQLMLNFDNASDGARTDALHASAVSVGDPVFRRYVIAYADGREALLKQIQMGYTQLWLTQQRCGDGPRFAGARYASLMSPDLTVYADEATPTRERLGCVDAWAAALEGGNYSDACAALERIGDLSTLPDVVLPVLGLSHALRGQLELASRSLDQFLVAPKMDYPLVIHLVVVQLIILLGRSQREYLEEVCSHARAGATGCGGNVLILRLALVRASERDFVGALDAHVEYMVGEPGGSTWNAPKIKRFTQRQLPSAAVDSGIAAAQAAASASATAAERRRYRNIAVMLDRFEHRG